jgi:hypothetical protein
VWNAVTQSCDFAEPIYATNLMAGGVLAQRMAQSSGIAWRLPNIKELMILRDFEGDTGGICGQSTFSEVLSSTYNTASPGSTWLLTCYGIRSSSVGFTQGAVVLIAAP